MPVKRRRTTYRRRRVGRPRRYGRGLWDSLKSAHNWIKSNKIISTVGNALGRVGVPYASQIGTAAGALGYGRRRYRRVGRPRVRRTVLITPGGIPVTVRRRVRRVGRRRVIGGSLRSVLGSVHRFVKDKKLVSGALSHFGHPKLAGVASSLGYGRRRRPVRRRVYRGGAITDQMGAIRF